MRLMLFGGGDLGRRVLEGLSALPAIRDVVLVTRNATRGNALARLFSGCLTARVRHVALDFRDEAKLASVLAHERPDLVFHAASLVSPWFLADRDDERARTLRSAGFALMLPAQLPLIRSVMRAVRAAELSCPVVNASYPDATHAVLAAEGLAPTIGVGNAGMLHMTLTGDLRRQGDERSVRLLAHHAHVTPFARGEGYGTLVRPWLFLDEQQVSIDDVTHGCLPEGRVLNALTAAHALDVIGALLGARPPLHTSAPGPWGLPGGWPVFIDRGRVALELPTGVTMEQALAYQMCAAEGDGIARIDPDGTVHYTEAVRDALRTSAPGLDRPLSRDGEAARLEALLGSLAA